MFIDTHCHLNVKTFDNTVATLVERARTQKVETIIIPGIDIPTSQKAIIIAKEAEDNMYALVGIHPHEAGKYIQAENGNALMKKDVEQLKDWLTLDCVRGVGEVGLDKHAYREERGGPLITIDEVTFQVQKHLFSAQVKLATRFNKSLSIHVREASADLVEMFENELSQELGLLAEKSVLHCCEPNVGLLRFAQENNFFMGVDGDVTFSNEKREFIRLVPLDLLVLETDAPYLLPEPLRSEKKYPNEPANIPLIANVVAQTKGISLHEVARVTTQNARKLFCLPE